MASLYSYTMASSNKPSTLLALLLVVLLPMVAKGDLLSGLFEKVCEEVYCGKGTCVSNRTYAFNYVCECEPGWKRSRFEDVDDELVPFLPCVIPNCTLNYSCQPAPPPVPATQVPNNISFFDPCYWAYCGEGSCTQKATYNYGCSCNSGFYNLLNTSFFPCYSDCTIGSDCASLGIKVANQETTNSNHGGSPATSILPGKLHWIIISIISVALFMRN